jgi:hypothetical protein
MTTSEAEKEFEEVWEREHQQTHADGCLCIACEEEKDWKPTALRYYLEAYSNQQEKIKLLKEGIKKFLFRYEPDRLKAEDELQKLLDET